MFGQGPLVEPIFFRRVVGVVGHHEVANACSTEATVLVGPVFGQIGPTGRKVRGDFGQKWEIREILGSKIIRGPVLIRAC